LLRGFYAVPTPLLGKRNRYKSRTVLSHRPSANQRMSTNNSDGGKSIDYTDAETLQRLYWDDKLTTREIGDKAGVSKTTIRRWMDKNDIDVLDSAASRRRGAANYFTDSDGYVRMTSAGDMVRVHQLLAIAKGHDAHKVFSGDYHTHHITPIKWLNTVDNVTLLTESEHMKLHGEQDREDRVLTPSDAKEIYHKCHHTDDLQKDIAEEYGVSPQLVTDIKKKRRWARIHD